MGEQALWIGGPPGSGKTTVASLIARRRGLRWYNSDTRTWEHRDRAIAAGNPAAIRFEELPIAERWSAPIAEMLAMSLHHERGRMILDDVRDLPPAPLTIAEGTAITPAAVGVGANAVWLLPSVEVQRERLAERGLSQGVSQLYQALVHEIESQVREYGGNTLIVDGRTGLEDTVAAVEEIFGPALDAGPVAATVAERSDLLRYSNRATAYQYETGFARPWATGDIRVAVRPFACECGATDCTEQLELTVADFLQSAANGLVLAEGHRL